MAMNEFAQRMSERTDEQLVEIVSRKRHEYQPEALLAADEEFRKRHLSADVLEEADLAIAAREAQAKERAEDPLGGIWKGLAFLFPGVIFFLAMLILKADGRERQSRELGRWTLYGIAFYIILIVLITNS
jgi:hypothetical protein